MWSYLLTAVGSSLFAFLATLFIGWRVKTRLVERLMARQGILESIRDLENRRVGYESEREFLARRNAGKVGRVTDGMTTKPGSLAKHHRS